MGLRVIHNISVFLVHARVTLCLPSLKYARDCDIYIFFFYFLLLFCSLQHQRPHKSIGRLVERVDRVDRLYVGKNHPIYIYIYNNIHKYTHTHIYTYIPFSASTKRQKVGGDVCCIFYAYDS
jgi:hypothetical protein